MTPDELNHIATELKRLRFLRRRMRCEHGPHGSYRQFTLGPSEIWSGMNGPGGKSK